VKKILWIFLGLVGINLVSTQLKADIDVYQFSGEDNRQLYLDLTKQLRCPKCQNQDIADSNAPIASDMRREVHRLVEAGQTKDEIVAFMVERFGEFVSYKPKVIPATYMLWFGPWILVICGVTLVYVLARKRRTGMNNQNSQLAGKELSEQQRQQLDRLMTRYSSDLSPEKNEHRDD